MKNTTKMYQKIKNGLISFIEVRTKVISDIFKSAGLAIILVVILKDELANEGLYTVIALGFLLTAIYFGKEDK